MAVFGEVGLSGEIRSVPNAQERIKEAQKNGFKTVVIPKVNQPKQPIESMNVIAVEYLYQVLQVVFEQNDEELRQVG
jgi:DNA repair protein RadA/Sms